VAITKPAHTQRLPIMLLAPSMRAKLTRATRSREEDRRARVLFGARAKV
jgi:hypothetical protein